MTRWNWQALAVSIAVGASPMAHADMLDTTGLKTHEVCAECHSLDGNNRMSRFPKLAGQTVDYIVKQLADMKSGARVSDNGAMQAIVEELTAADMREAAEHFSAHARSRVTDEADPQDIATGRAIFDNGRRAANIAYCGSCHGEATALVEGAPLLFSQHATYLSKQLLAFKTGARRNDPGAVMRRIAAGLSEAEIAAVAAYLSSVPLSSPSLPMSAEK